MLHASKLQIRASEEFIVRACEISVKKFAGRQHQEIFVGFGGCTSKDNDVSGMSLWSMQTSQECWMFFLNFLSGFFNMFSWWNDKRTEGQNSGLSKARSTGRAIEVQPGACRAHRSGVIKGWCWWTPLQISWSNGVITPIPYEWVADGNWGYNSTYRDYNSICMNFWLNSMSGACNSLHRTLFGNWASFWKVQPLSSCNVHFKWIFSETPPAKTLAWILDHRNHSKSIPIDHRPEIKLGMMLWRIEDITKRY